MNTHPELGSWLVWALYVAGQALHLLSTAYYQLRSQKNAVQSFGSYVRVRWLPILCRLFLTTLTFVLVWNNPALINIERLIPTVATQIAMAGILGWFSDSLFDKVISLIPALRGELPGLENDKDVT